MLYGPGIIKTLSQTYTIKWIFKYKLEIWNQKHNQLKKKKKKDKLNVIKIKNFCASKYTIKKVKRQSKEWKKIFANHLFIKGLMSRIYKECV